MMRVWIGVALLSISWLFASDYYYPASPIAWLLTVVVGTSLLTGVLRAMPSRRDISVAAALMLLAVWFAPWPFRAAPLLVFLGLMFELIPLPRRCENGAGWTAAGRGAIVAGVVMMFQAATTSLYARATARSHDLPYPLPDLLAALMRWTGVDATADGSEVVLYSMRQQHRLAATWDLLIDPATLCFLVGSIVLLGVASWSRLSVADRWPAFLRAIRSFAIVVVAWIPIRAVLLIAVYIDRVIRWPQHWDLHAMNHIFSPWTLLFLLVAPVLLSWRFVHVSEDEATDTDESSQDEETAETSDGATTAASETPQDEDTEEEDEWPYPVGATLILFATMLAVIGYHWDPIGARQQGRVKVVERHSIWEPTGRRTPDGVRHPYDTNWFCEEGDEDAVSSYNYAAIYDYLDQYYEMSRLEEEDKISGASLAECDVLILKTPTARYSNREIQAIVDFVNDGGGVLMIGDHTNVFRTGTYLNDIARNFGFAYRHDLLFSNTAFSSKPGTLEWEAMEHHPTYLQLYRKPHVPHPVVQHLPPTDLAVSCSIDPGRSSGRAVLMGTGLWSLPPDYHLENYHTVPQHRPDMRYGSFIQLWSTRPGKGRVLAFTDSTIFSSFATFQPGKAELMLGMVEWLNHRSTLRYPHYVLWAGAIALLAGGIYFGRLRRGGWLLLAAGAMFGWVLGSGVVIAIGQAKMPMPQPREGEAIPRIVIDRTVSDVPLSKGAYIQGGGEGYGMLEQWISRLGCYTTRQSDDAAFSGDMLVVICPSRSVSSEFRTKVKEYVEGGGKLLVIDSVENVNSTANSLLWPLGLSILRHAEESPEGQGWRGFLTLGPDWPNVRVESAYEVRGGQPCVWMADRPVAAVRKYPETGGQVMAIGCGSVFNDRNMGSTWMTVPDADLLARFDVVFALVRSAATGNPVPAIPPERGQAPAKPQSQPQPQLQPRSQPLSQPPSNADPGSGSRAPSPVNSRRRPSVR